jgi:Mrp family chromosome partitioning ATPase
VGEVIWGDLDYLIVDLPPGTGDEAMSIAQILGNPLSAVIVTTPQEVALLDSRKSVMFARTLGLDIVGIIENMSGLKCPHCSEIINLFKTGGGKKAAEEMGLNFLGALPIIPEVVKSADAGIPLLELDEASGIGVIFKELARNLDDTLNTRP